VNPIQAISLNLEQLRGKNALKEDVSEAQASLQRALQGTDRLEQYIAAAKKQVKAQAAAEWFSVREALEQAVAVTEYRARRAGVEIELEVSADLELFGDATRFHQAIMNLITNAIDASEEVERADTVSVVVSQTEQEVFLFVRDRGVGIAADDLKRIFEPLFTTKGSERGFGLGLTMVREVIEELFQGSLHFESKLGTGTTVYITIPKQKG
jgi:signal transduction histidine kinase